MILKFFDIFLKMKNLSTSEAFMVKFILLIIIYYFNLKIVFEVIV